MRTIRCWQLRSGLTSYVDNEVTAGERLRVEDHLRRCDACCHRVRRQQAVRQRLRRWSAEMNGNDVLLSAWPAEAETMSRRRGGTLLRIGVVSSAAIALVFVIWSGGPGRAVALAARGQITDSLCASGHSHTAPALRSMSGRDCVRRCVEMGAEYVFVSEGAVYRIRNQDFVDLMHLAGQDVQLEGELRRNVLTVSQVRPLTAHRSNSLFLKIRRVS